MFVFYIKLIYSCKDLILIMLYCFVFVFILFELKISCLVWYWDWDIIFNLFCIRCIGNLCFWVFKMKIIYLVYLF